MTSRVGGAEFGVILIDEPQDLAEERAQVLADVVPGRPVVFLGHEVALSLVWGVHFLQDGENAGAAMNAADRRMRAFGQTESDD